jgi:DHA1 family tetracycline resistance protein-like MFS transporter
MIENLPESSSAEPARAGPARKAAFAFILMTLLLDVMSLGLIIPVWPQLLLHFLGSMANGGWWVGLSGTTWALMQFFCQPTAGALSDKLGRRPIILASNLGTGVDYLVMAMAPGLWWLLVGRIVSGITSSSIGTAFAYVADVTPPEKRAARFGLLGAIFGLGFMLGPALGAVLGDPRFAATLPGTDWRLHGDWRLPFFVAGALSLLNFCYGLFVLPESLPAERRDGFKWAKANPLGSLQLLRSHPDLLPLASVLFFAQLAHYVLQTVFTLYAAAQFRWGAAEIGAVMVGFGLCGVIVQGGLTGPAVKALGERRAIAVGLTCGAAGLLIFALAPAWRIFVIGVPVMSLWGLAGPSTQSLMSRRVSVSEQGKLQGANQGLVSIAGLIGPALYGSIYALFDDRWKSLGLPGAPFVVGAGVLLTAMLISLWATRDAGRREADAAAA